MTKPTFQPEHSPHTLEWNDYSTFSSASLEARFVLFINTEKKITTSIGRFKQEELNIIKLDYSC